MSKTRRRLIGGGSLHTAVLTLGLLVLAACDDGSSSLEPAGDATLVGSVEEAPGPANGASGAPAQSTAAAATADVRTVAAGHVRANGEFQVVAEASVEADGTFRIEGVPAGRSDLVVRARSEAGTSLGEAIVWGETRSGGTTLVPPITARTTTEARVEAHLVTTGRHDPATRAELALLLALESGAGASATSAARIEALADAFSEGRAALVAHLEAAGASGSAQARADAGSDAVADFGVALASGTGIRTAHRALVQGWLTATLDAGSDEVAAEAIVLATASASQRIAAVVAARVDHAATRVAAVRSSFLLNVEARHALAQAQDETTLGLRAEVQARLNAARARIDAAGSLAELRAGLEQERATLESRLSATVLEGLTGLDLESQLLVDARVRTAVAQAAFWTRLEGAASVEATVQAAATYRTELEAAVDAWIEALPAEAQAAVHATAAFRLFLALGGGASVAAS